MTKQDKIKFIRDKCIEANPYDLGIDSTCLNCEKRYCVCIERDTLPFWEHKRRFELADVLLAIEKLPTFFNIEYKGKGEFWVMMTGGDENDSGTNFKWNLKDNDLNNQDEPTLDSLCKLLKED